MKYYFEAAVVLETITVKAESLAQAEEMYNIWHLGGFCPHHPEQGVGNSDWDCGCAETDEDIYHTVRNAGLVPKEEQQ
jgi:hypothetical protein